MGSDSNTSSAGDPSLPSAPRNLKRKIPVEDDDESEGAMGPKPKGHRSSLHGFINYDKDKANESSPHSSDEARDVSEGERRENSADGDESSESSAGEELRGLLEDGEENSRRIKSKARVAAEKDVSRIFDDEDESDSIPKETEARDYYGDEQYDMSDFITDDEVSDESLEEAEDSKPEHPAAHRKESFRLKTPLSKYVSDSAWKDIDYLFGNGSDYAWALSAKEVDNNTGPMATELDPLLKPGKDLSLSDVYESQEIGMSMLTKEDEKICSNDIPERFQVENLVEEPDDYTKEAAFIYRNLADYKDSNRILKIPQSELNNSILKILNYIYVSKFEIPFIYYYKSDYIHPELTLNDLWKIYDLNKEYREYENKKKSAITLYKDVMDEAGLANDDVFDEFIDITDSMDDVSDLSAYISSIYSKEVKLVESRRHKIFKRMIRPTPYEIAKSENLEELTNLFCMDMYAKITDFVNNNEISYLETCQEFPNSCAEKYICDLFPTAEDVLAGARVILAEKLAAYPKIRKFVRNFSMSKAMVTIKTTPKFDTCIDSSHQYYNFKNILNKKLHKFVDHQLAQIVSAESKGFLEIELNAEGREQLVQSLSGRFSSGKNTPLSKEWDNQRAMVVSKACNDIIFPKILKIIRDKYLMKSNLHIASKCSGILEEKINMAPYVRENENDSHKSVRVLAASWGNGALDDIAYFVSIKKNGEFNSVLEIPQLHKIKMDPNLEPAAGILEFIDKNNIDVVAISGFKPNIRTKFYAIIVDLVRLGKESGILKKIIPVFITNDEFSRICMNSNIYTKEFPESKYPSLVRYCISLGRFLQDPTMEASCLFNQNNDIINLNLTNLQNLIPENMLLEVCERAFVKIVCLCGVEINSAVKHPHLSHTLQFVPGLGKRKAHIMLENLRSSEILKSRADLIKRRICGQKVFMNCAAFIRIGAQNFKSNLDFHPDVLDDTRIHPEDYDLARKMAADALDLDDLMLDGEENQSQYVEELMESKHIGKLKQLALDEFAIELEKMVNEKKRLILYDIVNELIRPFKERRISSHPATPMQIFTMLTNETPETLYEGLIVTAHVLRVEDRDLKCRLPSGIDATISSRNIDLGHGGSLQSLFRQDQTLQCRVLRVDVERLSVELTLRNVNIKVTGSSRDELYRQGDFNIPGNGIAYMNKTPHININHNLFRNLDMKGVHDFLSQKTPGSIVIHPSPKIDTFYITCKVIDNLLLTTLVDDATKAPSEKYSGRTFIVDNITFGEIDQIIAEYVELKSKRIAQLYKHKKFKALDINAMSNFLINESKLTKMSAYGIIPTPQNPDKLELVYKHPVSRVQHETITVTPEGYKFRKNIFHSVDELFVFFKEREYSKSRTQPQSRQMPANYSNSYIQSRHNMH